MKIQELKKILNSTSRLQLNWSRDVGYVFVAPSQIEGEYEVVVPATWPVQLKYNLSFQWAVHCALNAEEIDEIEGTPLISYRSAIFRLMAEMEQLIEDVTSFVKAHKGLDQKAFAELVVDKDHKFCIMGRNRSIKTILFDARKRSPLEAVNAFYEKYATGIFYP